MVSKVDQLSTVEVSKKKSQLLQLVDGQFFVDFAVDFSSDFSGKMEEFVQNGLKIFKKIPSKSTVDYVADPRSCNSLLFSRKLTNCRLKKKKSNDCRQLVNFQKKIPQQSIYRQKSTVDFKA
jgi:hypothetical protein